ATEFKGKPTVILAKTVKGYGLGPHFEGRNATHQMKKLTLDDLKKFRDHLRIPITDEQLEKDPYQPPYYHPGTDAPEIQYMMERRAALGGSVPERRSKHAAITLPDAKSYEVAKRGSGKQQAATTMAFVRLLKDLMRDKEFGKHIAPIIPDEARTFGMDAFFPTAKIYNPKGQNYLSVDRDLVLAYKESPAGQLIHPGINEAGAVAAFTAAGTAYATHGVPLVPVYVFYSMFGFQRTAGAVAAFTAAGTAYATHGVPLVPVYVFYSMFGFQRTGDAFWAAADQMTRGFIIGATAGRTTLTGEGLQHADGHSPLLASTNPAVVTYDPAYGYEMGHIIRDGLERMYGPAASGEGTGTAPDNNVMYYLTVYNEPITQPAEPENLDVEGVLKGIYRVSPSAIEGPTAQILASGVSVPWALEAQRILAEDWGVSADVWSVTSWNELRRDGLAAEEEAFLNPGEPARVPFVTRQLEGATGPVVAVSDYMKAVPDQIRQFVPNEFATLGADGFGFSDTRAAARRFFKNDTHSIVVKTLQMLAARGEVEEGAPSYAMDRYKLLDVNAGTTGGAGGDA
ncbi:pyruvate dehydrogenase (acetyl-transferring), homodimeric type, partial [Pseudarthrobacter sp. R1]|uniref:transketolase-like TK C-terminal-containing protein n=1 Tax=Pseudarthrobacter sp. R1 TaxID=2944934 RepID=UPI003F8ECA47|nr:pyruvate dehydrogenase (acetyl-transferring), homodimeric type [Pseudarthrobacter sp. R1]